MREKELIAVYIDVKDGKTVCICKKSKKRCGKNCQEDFVERDKFLGWEQTMRRDRYGKG